MQISTKCPRCGKNLEVPKKAIHTADTYGRAVRVTTRCCGKIVRIIPIRSYLAERAEGIDWGDGPVDDWDVPEGKTHDGS